MRIDGTANDDSPLMYSCYPGNSGQVMTKVSFGKKNERIWPAVIFSTTAPKLCIVRTSIHHQYGYTNLLHRTYLANSSVSDRMAVVVIPLRICEILTRFAQIWTGVTSAPKSSVKLVWNRLLTSSPVTSNGAEAGSFGSCMFTSSVVAMKTCAGPSLKATCFRLRL
jgi:hypothetical protein